MKTYKQYSIPVFSLIFFVILWEGIVRLTHIENWILPTPSATLASLWESKQLLLQHSVVTIVESSIGLALAVVVAWSAATAMYFSSLLKKSLYPLLVISQTIPFIALAPLLVVWFGFGLLPKIIIVALVCFFPIAVNLLDGFTSVDLSIIHHMRVLGANHRQIFRFAILPASLPFFFSGLRIAGAYALLTALVAEWIGATDGLGVFITRASKSYLTDRVFATIFVVSLISLFTVATINRIYKFATPWRIFKN